MKLKVKSIPKALEDITYSLDRCSFRLWQQRIDLQAQLYPFPWQKREVKVAINMYPARGPWGGSSIFVDQVAMEMRRNGFRVVFNLSDNIDAILIIDPRQDLQNKAFGVPEIIQYKQRNQNVKIIHRINECDKRKNSDFIDGLLCQASQVADYTIFISEWLRDYFAEKWFDVNRPHRVIYNGADSATFHPVGGAVREKGDKLRLVTHHWSSNWMKGFAIYKKIDELIATGSLKDTELWIIGRWPESITWESARTFPATSGRELAGLLRQCHVYITASLWEPCGMHHIEGAQCGLPLLFHVNGGGIVEAGRRYGLGFDDDTIGEAISEMHDSYTRYREKLFEQMPNGNRMANEFVQVVYKLLANR